MEPRRISRTDAAKREGWVVMNTFTLLAPIIAVLPRLSFGDRWRLYEARKRELQAADLPADEYEAAIAELVEELGV